MFKHKNTSKSNKPVDSVMLVVKSYTSSSQEEGAKIDTVVGTDLTGRELSIILTTTGEAADKENRNDMASFAKEKSNHHVPEGGLMMLNTVWLREPEAEGQPYAGIARWAEFFAHSQEELTVGNAMFFAGTNPANGNNGQERNWAVVDRMGTATALPQEKVDAFVASLADRCANDGSRAKPLVRLMSKDGEVVSYASLKQGTVEDGKGGKRIQTGEEMVASSHENKAFKALLEKASADNSLTIEVIPVMSVPMSPKMMNSGRGKNFLALAKKFSNDSEIFGMECYIRRAPTDEYNFISHFAPAGNDRFDPLLLPSQTFQAPAYSDALLREMGVDPASVKKSSVEQAAPNVEGKTPEPDHDDVERAMDDAPGFD